MRGPLHGIPILIKDNIATGRPDEDDGRLARARGRQSRADAFVVKRLRDAGAVILGKTNLSEWANFRSTHSSSGWSGRGGQCRNPYALDRNPSGSSSGSGAAVAANLCAAAVGTETDGSIVSPVDQLRPRRHQADARPRRRAGDHPDRPQPGHRRADDAHRRGRRDPARRARRRRRGRRGDEGPRGQGGRATTRRYLDADGLAGRAHRRRRARSSSATEPGRRRARRGRASPT